MSDRAQRAGFGPAPCCERRPEHRGIDVARRRSRRLPCDARAVSGSSWRHWSLWTGRPRAPHSGAEIASRWSMLARPNAVAPAGFREPTAPSSRAALRSQVAQHRCDLQFSATCVASRKVIKISGLGGVFEFCLCYEGLPVGRCWSAATSPSCGSSESRKAGLIARFVNRNARGAA